MLLKLKSAIFCQICNGRFSKSKKGSMTSFGCKFSSWFLHRNVLYLILYQWTKFQCHTLFLSQDIKQNVLFNRDLNRGCLVYMLSLRFSGRKFLINLRRQFRVTKIFRTQLFAGFEVILCLKLLFRKCVPYVTGCSFTKTCSLTRC